MSKSVEVISIGTTRTNVVTLTPGRYQIGDSEEWAVIRRRCTIEVVQTFKRPPEYPLTGTPRWVITQHKLDTLTVLPTWWERLKAVFARRSQPIPRAVTIIDRSAR